MEATYRRRSSKKYEVEEDRDYFNINYVGAKDFGGFEFDVPRRCEQDGAAVGEVFDEKFANGWEGLSQMAADEISTGKRKRGRKQRIKSHYAIIVEGLESHANKYGFTDSELEIIWKVASNRNIGLNCTQRRQLIFTMIPQTKAGIGVINSIVWWLKDAGDFKPTVVVGVYQLLNLYFEYGLVEDGGIANEVMLTRLLRTHTGNFTIPWKMYLFRSVVTPEILGSVHIHDLQHMLKIKDSKKTHMEDINATLSLCQHVRPDLFPEGTEKVISSKQLRFLNFPKKAREQFYRCKLRVQSSTAQCGSLSHPMADDIFPEFLPSTYSNNKYARKSPLEMMLGLLKTKQGVSDLAKIPSMLHLFCEWFAILAFHRLHPFSGFGSTDDMRRYGFLFDRCLMIVEANQEGPKEITNWLAPFLSTWDFIIFKTSLNGLLPYVHPKDMLSWKNVVRQVFVDRFTHCTWARSDIWESLNTLAVSWIIKLKAAKSKEYAKGLIWLLDVMEQCVSGLVLSPDFDDPVMVYRICLTYKDFISRRDEVEDVTVKSKLNHFPNGLDALACLSQNIDCLKLLCELVKGIKSDVGAVNTESTRSSCMMIDGLVSGALVPYIEKKLPPSLKISAASEFEQFRLSENLDLKNLLSPRRSPQLAIAAAEEDA